MKRKSNRLFLVIYSVIIILISLEFFCSPVYSWEIDTEGTVTYIVDGDTFDVSSVGRIRLADIDCPESGESGGEAATTYVEALIYQKEVYIDVDDITGTDPYGRIVAVVYVYFNESHLKNVNKALLVAGHAEIWDFDNNEFNPYEWTLYVEYPTNPPPDNPPDIPPPSDDGKKNNKNSNTSSNVPLTFGILAIGIGTVSGIYAYYNFPILKRKYRKLKLKLKERYNIIKKQTKNRIEHIEKENIVGQPIEKDLATIPEEVKFMIKDISLNMHNITIKGEIKKIEMPHEFSRKDGSIGQVGSFWLSDITGTIRIVLWDDNCCFLKNGECTVGKHIKIINGYSKVNTFYGTPEIEIHLGKNSRLEIENG